MTRRIRLTVLLAAVAVLVPLVPAHAADPFGSTPCAGVRPGALMEGPPGIAYTMGFLVQSTSKGVKTTYMVTVGDHVIDGQAGKKIWGPGKGPKAIDAAGKKFGNFAYAAQTATPDFTTIALIRIDKGIKFNPQVCHFGGPIGVYTNNSSVPVVVNYYGQGFPFDQFSPARSGLADGTPNQENAYTQGAYGPVGGDEGAPVLIDGKAVGFINNAVGAGPAGAGFVVARLTPMLRKAENDLKLTELKLLTAKPL